MLNSRKFGYLQLKAIILTLCTLFYLVEYVSMPRMMVGMATQMAAVTHQEGSCCQGSGGSTKHATCPKSTKDCKSTTDCCVNCPMCYVTIMPASADHLVLSATTIHYAEWHSSYLYQYQSDSWKPPNAA